MEGGEVGGAAALEGDGANDGEFLGGVEVKHDVVRGVFGLEAVLAQSVGVPYLEFAALAQREQSGLLAASVEQHVVEPLEAGLDEQRPLGVARAQVADTFFNHLLAGGAAGMVVQHGAFVGIVGQAFENQRAGGWIADFLFALDADVEEVLLQVDAHIAAVEKVGGDAGGRATRKWVENEVARPR